jgi:cell division protein FtsI (penicillin-binding protein 3)
VSPPPRSPARSPGRGGVRPAAGSRETAPSREPLASPRPEGPSRDRPAPGRSGGRVTGRRPPRLAGPRRRLRAGAVLLVLLLVALVARLTQIQGFQAASYAREAELQRLHIVALPAVRGTITDQSGATLAEDVDARAVYADPATVVDPAHTAALLAPLLHLSPKVIAATLTGSGRFAYLARCLKPSVGNAVSAVLERDNTPGIGVLDERCRFYPSGDLASNVIGFTTSGTGDTIVGGGGLELAYDTKLRGTDGLRQLQEDSAGRAIASAEQRDKDPVPGQGLRLTLDRDIQWAAQNAIAGAVASTKAASGTVVVLDPHTGNILAMADAPSFDPNNLRAANPAALGNRATSDPYEPGSVNKVVTMAAAINRGLITPETPVTVPSYLEVGGRQFHDAEPHGVEHLTAAGVLAKSSNLGTIEIAQRLGSQSLDTELRAFGLGAPTALDFPGESAGVLPPLSQWSPTQAATIPFGQGMSATALQMASVYATIANGGVRVAPRLVAATVSPDGAVHPTPPSSRVRVVSAATARTVSEMLEQVTGDGGTAPAAAIEGYRVAGKTGTANRVDPTCRCYRGYTASFIGYAPADSPSVVVEVVLDNPTAGHFGGAVAAPVFKTVMTFALATLDARPTGTRPPNMLLDLDAGTVPASH